MREFVQAGAKPAVIWPAPFGRLAIAQLLAVSCLALVALFGLKASAQTADPRATDATKQGLQSDTERRANEFTEAAQTLSGPAGNPECVFVGRRIVVLMSRDDLDTALRFADLYDRFGCPGGHVQAAFRCLAKSGYPGASKVENLPMLVHTCWVNPAAQLPTPAPAAPAAAK